MEAIVTHPFGFTVILVAAIISGAMMGRYILTVKDRDYEQEADDFCAAIRVQSKIVSAKDLETIRAAVEPVECCCECGYPKTRTNKPGDEVYLGWPACVNALCPCYMEGVASAVYYPAERNPRVLANHIKALLAHFEQQSLPPAAPATDCAEVRQA